MRNLKRALSLTLASVMLLGMMVVGSSAAGFPDVTEEDNVEAIEVLKAVEVMIGDDNGNFGPNDPVNRSQMAVVMAKLLNLDYQYYESSCIFWDVPTWARGYVGACYAKGIVSGYGGTTYGAADTVTAVQAASMMMRALGYFQYAEDYKGGFELATVSKGTDIGIFKGVGSSATAPMTRNQVAQMALNALQSEMVTFTGTPGVTIGDATVGYRAEYTPRTSTEIKYQAIEKRTSDVSGGNNLNRGQYYVQLGEELYDGKLKLRDDLDAFVRPARHWEYDGKDIGTYVKKELIKQEYVGEVVGKDLYDLLGKSTIEEYDLSVALDGVTDPVIVREVLGYDGDTVLESKHNQDYIFDKADLNRNNKGTVGGTGTGVLTQVFVDDQTEDIYIAVINTYLALADKDYDTKKEELSVQAYSITKNRSEYVKKFKNGEATQIFKLSNEDFNVEGLSKDTPMLLTIADGEVQTAVPAEVLSAVTVSSFKRSSNVVVDGTKYDFTTTAGFKAGPEHLKSYTDQDSSAIVNLKDTVYNVYLDAYGNLIGVEEVDPVKNYVFIAGIEVNDSNLTNKNVDASALFLDGTVDTIRVNMGKSDMPSVEANATDVYRNSILNTWCTYTVNDSGIYTLTEVVYADDLDAIPGGKDNKTKTAQVHQYMDNSDADKNFEIDQKHIALKGRDDANTKNGELKVVYGNEDTVYLTATLGKVINGGTWGVIKGVDTRTVGVENANATVWNGANSLTAANQVKPTEKPVANANDTSKGVYTLYNSDGIIIGAVMVGEDNGAAKNLVYVHSSDVNSESYNGSSSSKAAGDGMWTWTRDVIMNGEEVTLTEVSDSDSALRRMNQYFWYQVKLNGDGEVIDAFKIDETYSGDPAKLEEASLVNQKDFTVVPEEIEETINAGKETVLFFSNEKIHDSLSMNGRTLYVKTSNHTGFVVDKNVKYVLQQWNNNKNDTVISEGQGSEGLKSVISEINQRYGTLNGVQNKYDYRVSAILKNGIATSVVIWDDNNDYERPSGNYGLRTMRFDVDEYNLNDFDFILNDKELTRDDFTFTTVNGVRVMELKVRAEDYLSIRSLDETFAPTGSFMVGDTRVTVNSTGTRLSFTVDDESIYFGQIKNIKDTTAEIKGENKPVDPVDPEKKYYTVTFNEGDFTAEVEEKYEENTKVEIKITAKNGYELVSVDGVTLEEGTTEYTYTIEKITGNVTVAVVTKETGSETPDPGPSGDVEAVFSNGKANVTLPDTVEAGKTIIIKVTGVDQNGWYKVIGGSLKDGDGAAQSKDATLRFRYTPNASDVAAKNVNLEFAKFNATSSTSEYVETLGAVDGGLGIVKIPNITASAPSARSIVPGHTEGLERGDYAEMVLGGDAKNPVPGCVNADGNVVFPMSLADALAVIDRFNALEAGEDGYVDLTYSTSAVTVGGGDETVLEPIAGGYRLNVWMSAPKAPGVKLPNTITITDDKGNEAIEAKVEWLYNGNIVNAGGKTVYVGMNENPANYTYRIIYPKVIAENADEFFPITINTKSGTNSDPLAKSDFEKVAFNADSVTTGATESKDPTKIQTVVQNGTNFTFNYNGVRPSKAEVEQAIKEATGAEVVTVTMPADTHVAQDTTGTMKEKKVETTEVSINVKLNPQTEVKYNGQTIGWVDKKSDNSIAVGSFETGAVLIGGKEGTRVDEKLTVASGKVTPKPDAWTDEENTGDDVYYIYDAVNVVSAAAADPVKAVTLESWDYANAEELADLSNMQSKFTGGTLAVVPGVKLVFKGSTGAENDVLELRFNTKSTDKSQTVKLDATTKDTGAIYKEVVISADMVDKTTKKVTVSEYGPIVTVKMAGKEFTVLKTTGTLDVKTVGALPENAAYILKTDNGTATAKEKATQFGALATPSTTYTEDTELFEAYTVSAETGVVTTKTADKAAFVAAPVTNVTVETLTGATETAVLTSDMYVIPGTQVFIRAAKVATELTAEGVTLVRCAALDDAGKFAYYFIMPQNAVTIEEGASAEISPIADGSKLNQTNGTVTFTVSIENAPEGATLTFADPMWTVNASSTLKANTPEYLSVSIGQAVVNGKTTTWTVTLKSSGEKEVAVGTYYLNLNVNGTRAVQTINVTAPDPVEQFSITSGPDSIKYGTDLTTAPTIAAGTTGLTNTDADITGEWAASNGGEITGGNLIAKAGTYTLTFSGVEAEAGKAITAESIPTIAEVEGVYNASAKTLTYTFTLAAAPTPVIDGISSQAYDNSAAVEALTISVSNASDYDDVVESASIKWTMNGGNEEGDAATAIGSGLTTGTNYVLTVNVYSGDIKVATANVTFTVSA